MKLLINTGGKALRLRPLTNNLPKPMIPIGGKPLLEYLVEWAKSCDIEEIVMLNGYLHEEIENYFGDGSKFGIRILHSNEPEPLGSGGSVKFAARHITAATALINGDLLCKVNLKKMIEYHNKANKAKNPVMTTFLHTSNHPEDSDIVVVDKNSRVTRFVGKHEDHTGSGALTNAGLFIIEPEILEFMKPDKFTFETYLYPALLNSDSYINGYVSEEYIKDMGTPDRLAEAKEYLKSLGH